MDENLNTSIPQTEPTAAAPGGNTASSPYVQPAPAPVQPTPSSTQPQFSQQPAYQPPQTQQPADFQRPYPNPGQSIPQQPINNQNFQAPTKFCKFCGARIPMDAVICTACGRQVEMLSSSQPASQPVYIQNINTNNNTNNNNMNGKKPLDKWVAFFLCFFLGWMGAHKFYEGRIGMGLVYLFTFGGFGIGWFLDTIVLLFKPNPYYLK